MKNTTCFATMALLALVTRGAMAQPSAPPAPAAAPIPIPPADLRITTPGSPFGAGWAFLYGYSGIPAATYVPLLRQMGGGFTKIYLIWNQVEPAKGHYDWTAVDAFVNQLKSPDEGLISVFSSSQWATRVPSAMLPPSPAKNPGDYARFIHDLVKHCQGRVRCWENDAEPSNPVYWSGTKEEFVAELKLFYKAVKEADPKASVIVGGYDGMFGPPGTHQLPMQQAGLNFFDYVLKEGRAAFDVFDLRLYGDPYTIPARVDYMRRKMLALGYDKPFFSTEYGGPNLFEFPVNRKYVPLVLAWSRSMANPNAKDNPKTQIEAMYKNMSTLAPETQMFMLGCPPELNAKYERIQARGLVMRNVLGLSAGVQKMLYWQFLNAHGDRDDMMTLMYGKIGMVGEEDGKLQKRYLVADVFERMAKALDGVEAVKRIDAPGRPDIFLFEIDRAGRRPAYVVWQQRDMFTGEDSPPVPFDWAWRVRKATALDALGRAAPLTLKKGRAHLAVSLTPIFVEPGR
jgi:hypothetical protein